MRTYTVYINRGISGENLEILEFNREHFTKKEFKVVIGSLFEHSFDWDNVVAYVMCDGVQLFNIRSYVEKSTYPEFSLDSYVVISSNINGMQYRKMNMAN